MEKVWLHEFLTAILGADEWTASHACPFIPVELVPSPCRCFVDQVFSKINLQGNVIKFPVHNYRCQSADLPVSVAARSKA